MRIVPIAVAVVGALAVIGWYAFDRSTGTAFTVQPGQQAVVVAGGEVVDVLGPGAHRLANSGNPAAVLYTTGIERTLQRENVIDVGGCPADLTFIYNIADAAEFHSSGGEEQGAVAAMVAEAERHASTLAVFGEDPRSEMQVHLLEHLRENQVSGLGLVMLLVSLGDCVPQTE